MPGEDPTHDAAPGAEPAAELATELATERAYTDTCRAALDRTDAATRQRVREGAGVVTGRHSGDAAEEGVAGDGASAEALGRYLRSRAKEVREEPDGPPFFGRLDFRSEGPAGDEAGEHRGQRYYIGRRRVSAHPSAPPLVLDWRAPVSRAFYQATARAPQGVGSRRRFGWAPGGPGTAADLTGLEDEPLADAGAGGDGTASALSSGIVAEEIERPRVGPMRDIVATLQPEQDDLVRSGPGTSLCVQGAPGTGKTAVGLHRAAYLLYTYPRRIERGGLLVVGPNAAFLHYISAVLPSLGEGGVRQCTVADLLPAHEVTAEDAPDAVEVKHDARMASVLHRALYARVRLPDGPLAVPDGSYRWRLDEEELHAIVEETLAQQPPYEVGRERVRARTVALLRDRAERRAGPPGGEWLRRMGRKRELTAFLDAVWPRTRPEEVVAGLLGDPRVLAAAGEGLLEAHEQRALLWAGRRPRTPRTARWSRADLLLLDEVAGLIEHPEESFGHVVVDEAQDLSPMECRILARRSRFGSLTVLGDLAQGTTAWAARDWRSQLTHLGAPDAVLTPLTTGFRVPAALVEVANRLLGSLGVRVPAARSLRPGGELTRVPVSAPAEVPAVVAERVRGALEREGSVGVIAAGARVAALRDALSAAGVPSAEPGEEASAPRAAGEEASAARVTVVGAELSKGLEYDHVVLVEPAEIARSGPRGLQRLYVALTRAVSRLEIVGARELPAAVRA
ncbi:HelD family protein [Streptomyces reniochalinae]|uniref:AAA family ATPase n=1 Tax=Streptomyces reniochalinae TaxID=2250578 RepID=A0A367EBI2_9ACTN|nr:ATP-binding domain-containing protein [Streptomyces reniochalinae]RCG15426.1 AAA family ATPase [Streptomyces reniochalinae]